MKTKKMKFAAALGLTLTLVAGVGLRVAVAADAFPRFVVQKSADLPVTTFNLTFQTGSADDPRGIEGLAELTAHLVREGGVKALALGGRRLPARTRAEIEDFLFPLAADIGVSVEKEQISFHVTSTGADAPVVLELLAQLITAPAFDPTEFERLKAEALDALGKQWPREDEEELGKAVLDARIAGVGHPYSHVTTGTVQGVQGVTLEKVREFYRSRFTRKRLIVGMAGVVSPATAVAAHGAFRGLPLGETQRVDVPAAPESAGLRMTLVKGPFDAVGAHLGHPIRLGRADADFSGLFLASWGFGKHRSFVGRLMRVVREIRGLNYGTYAYVQDFPDGGKLLSEPTQAARSRQAFTLWARPTPLENACFMVRQVYREVVNLATDGLTEEEFALAKSHLVGNAPLLATGLERQLGYAIDSAFYGVKGDFLLGLQRKARALTREQVNALVKRYLHPAALDLVIVTPEPDRFKEELLSPRCEIHYPSGVSKPADVLEEDKLIAAFAVPVRPENITVVDSAEFFQR